MQRQNAAIILVSIALIFSVNAEDKSEILTDCVPFGEVCHLHRPCCGNYKCDLTDTFGRFECQEKVKLGDTCRNTDDCVDIVHSVCTKKKCQCRQSNVRVSDYACAPLLNTYCWKNETCAPENSLCINNECQCKDGYVAEDGKCLPVVIGSECSDDAACASVKFAKCSSRKVCACPRNTIATNSRLCPVALEETCDSNRDCGVTNSWCDNNKCQCRGRYVAYSNIECRLPRLGMSCEKSEECNDHIINSICFDNTCKCRDTHTPEEGNMCVATTILYCEEEEECARMNGACIYGLCQCRANYVIQDSKCLPTKLAGRCRIHSDCAAVNFALCLEGECTCSEGFFTVNATTCVRALGNTCISDKNCAVRFSSCYNRKCQCNHGYTQYSEGQCSATELGTTCFDNSTCNLIKNAYCFESQCTCNENHKEIDAFTCAPLLNANCSKVVGCAPENSVCIDHKCQCEFGYFPKSNYECVLRYPEVQCRNYENCIDIPNAKCSDAGECICRKNYVRSSPTTCLPTLGGNCSSNRECITVNARCFRNQCRCSPGYTQHSDDLCFPVFLGQKCDIDEDCDEISNAECSHKRCQCKEGYKKFNRKVCLPLIGTRCIEHKECAVYNSNCVENTCQCLDTFVPQTQFECVATGINVSCLTDSDCKLINTHCSKLKFCVCDQHYISMDNMTCVSILGGYCSENVTCTSPNSECIDNKCQCSPNYTPGPYNQCYPNLLGTSCQADYDCQYIPNAICIDKICVCKPNTFALTPSACTHLLNTSCSSSADCDVEASHCFENKCQCKPEWVALTDMTCVEHSAVYDCKEDFECGETWRTRCHQNKCVCNANHIAVSELTCLPILDGTCWRDDQCMTKNSHCDGSWCQCKPGFVSVAKNMCVLS